MRISGLGVVVRRDTRDDIYSPHDGSLRRIMASCFDSCLGSDFDFERYILDARGSIGVGKTQVLALQVYTHISNGEIPFQRPALIGVATDINIMRGYRDGRFLDKVSALSQAEYRFPIAGSWSAVGFGGLGQVGPDTQSLKFSEFKWTAGAGLRYRATKKKAINLRLDVGLGEEGAAVYFNIFEAL